MSLQRVCLVGLVAVLLIEPAQAEARRGGRVNQTHLPGRELLARQELTRALLEPAGREAEVPHEL